MGTDCPDCCQKCGSSETVMKETGPHCGLHCAGCGKWLRWVSKTDAGLKKRTVQTTHAAIKPKLRSDVLLRATGKCELCGKRDSFMHVGHLISVDSAHAAGLSDDVINSSENLCAMCEECNLGIGKEPVPLRLAIAMIMARQKKNGGGNDSH